MSFSRRASRWANAALVVTVSQKDFTERGCYGPLAGVKFQVPLRCMDYLIEAKCPLGAVTFHFYLLENLHDICCTLSSFYNR